MYPKTPCLLRQSQKKFKFQFPSNGKVYPKPTARPQSTGCCSVGVSIPFKRESVSKVKAPKKLPAYQIKFQFPSNGKVYPKENIERSETAAREEGFNSLQTGKCIQRSCGAMTNHTANHEAVSIPFKRESVSKVKVLPITTLDGSCFNSLQTGKCIQSCFGICRSGKLIKFQFPSNGKVYPKIEKTRSRQNSAYAIQFQFPSNGKVYPKSTSIRTVWLSNSFNSLQTGKCIQRIIMIRYSITHIVSIPFKRESVSKVKALDLHYKNAQLFQFPSNGKVYPKFCIYDF